MLGFSFFFLCYFLLLLFLCIPLLWSFVFWCLTTQRLAELEEGGGGTPVEALKPLQHRMAVLAAVSGQAMEHVEELQGRWDGAVLYCGSLFF